MKSLLRLVACFYFLFSALSTYGNTLEEEPIAYIGHGAFFDSKGKQIVPTQAFIKNAQNWYEARLLSQIDASKRAEYEALRSDLSNIKTDGQALLLVEQKRLEWLLANSSLTEQNHRERGKVNALLSAMRLVLPEDDNLDLLLERQTFELPPAVSAALAAFDFKPDDLVRTPTTNSGQAYINECAAAGVPIPPPIGVLDPAGLAGWKSHGFIPTGVQFIVGTPAEVRTFESTSPAGMCIALPRYSNGTLTTVALDGVICMGQASSKVCFWDNQMNGAGFSFAAGDQIPIGVADIGIDPAGRYQAGGFELQGGSGGECSDCHAGENPYVVHPSANLDPGGTNLLMGNLGSSPLNLPMFSNNRHDPLVGPAWWQNQSSHSQPLVPSVCSGCHNATGSGGRFPHLSTSVPSYCNTVLAQAITNTMPPGAPGSQATNPDVIAFQAFCGSAANSGPSNRGDPHLVTTNGTRYDFQAGGEFISLRNSDSGFELQTRQTPVSTTFTPGPNAYTGLASCVSLNTAAALRLGESRVSYQQSRESSEQLELRINGRIEKLERGGIDLGNGNRIDNAEFGGGIDVQSSDGTRVLITPNYWSSQGYWYLNVEVLDTPAREGTMGHIASGNWLPFAQDGSSFGPAPASIMQRHILLNKIFANNWRVTNSTSLFDYTSGTSTGDYNDPEWPPAPGKPCIPNNPTHPPVRPMEPQLARRICSVIEDNPEVFEACVFDAIATGDENTGMAFLTTLMLREAAE